MAYESASRRPGGGSGYDKRGNDPQGILKNNKRDSKFAANLNMD